MLTKIVMANVAIHTALACPNPKTDADMKSALEAAEKKDGTESTDSPDLSSEALGAPVNGTSGSEKEELNLYDAAIDPKNNGTFKNKHAGDFCKLFNCDTKKHKNGCTEFKNFDKTFKGPIPEGEELQNRSYNCEGCEFYINKIRDDKNKGSGFGSKVWGMFNTVKQHTFRATCQVKKGLSGGKAIATSAIKKGIKKVTPGSKTAEKKDFLADGKDASKEETATKEEATSS